MCQLIKGPELDGTRTSTELLQKYLRDLQELAFVLGCAR
jgi:hypothetical protein